MSNKNKADHTDLQTISTDQEDNLLREIKSFDNK